MKFTKNHFFYALRMFVFAALLPVLSLSLVGCEPDPEIDEEETPRIAVTGEVDAYGYTYAEISGYAHLHLLPPGGGNPVVGIEIIRADALDNSASYRETISSLMGNFFTVTFSNLSLSTKYKYRTFVVYDEVTYYGAYKMFTTNGIVNLTSGIHVSDVSYLTAAVNLSIQQQMQAAKEDLFVGVAYSTIETDLRADRKFCYSEISIKEVVDGEWAVQLKGLNDNTTYYYAAYTRIGENYAFSSVSTFKTLEFPEGAVDLGLSVLWASCNVGANSPEEYGDYFAWGETTTKSDYSSSTSVTYGLSISELKSRGIIDADDNLTAAYDAATANWGNKWRMPTLDEMKELVDKCTWAWTTQNGVKGRKVTGPNGNSIFLPAAGYRFKASLDYAGSYGYYWSATTYGGAYDNNAYGLYFNSGGYDRSNIYRSYGLAVRPVSEK